MNSFAGLDSEPHQGNPLSDKEYCVCLLLDLPGHGINFLLSLFQVAKELLQEICEQMGIGEQQEIQDFVLFAVRSDDKNLGK